MKITFKSRPGRHWIVALIFLIGLPHAFACGIEGIKKSEKSLYDVLCDQSGAPLLYLKYSPKQRKVWIESADRKIFKLIQRVEKSHNNDDAEAFIGGQFITRTVVDVGNKQFIGLIYSERSMRGNGGGYCGAGNEDYFIAFEKNGTRIFEIRRLLVSSCIKSIDLKADEVESGKPISIDKDTVIFRWLNYPPYEKTTTGKFSFLRNTFDVRENEVIDQWSD